MFALLRASIAWFALSSLGVSAQGDFRSVRIASGLQSPVLATAPKFDERVFVVERAGRILIIEDGAVLPTAFLDITSKVTETSGGGLLGLAFHRNYANNGFLYVKYTDLVGDTMVELYQSDPADPNLALPGSATTVIQIAQPDEQHNGGSLEFGADGKLYIGMGDGGFPQGDGAGEPVGANAQLGGTLLGKMLRLNVDEPFPHIPADNPYVNDPEILDEIWAFGLRNPFRFSVDPHTGDFYIGDVGQNDWEEISFLPAGTPGLNFGWNCMEGAHCTGLEGCVCDSTELSLPIHEYANGADCSVTGGSVYRGSQLGDVYGTYFFADVCSSKIWSLRYENGVVSEHTDRTAQLQPIEGSIEAIVAIAPDGFGELLIVDFLGEVYRMIPPGPADPLVYCTAKDNSLGCVYEMGFSGFPSVSSSDEFVISASGVVGQKPGLLFYGISGQAEIPFFLGTLCVTPPLRRLEQQSSMGNASDCSGAYSYDFQSLIQSGIYPQLAEGQQIHAQWYGRDTITFDGTGVAMSAALEFTIDL